MEVFSQFDEQVDKKKFKTKDRIMYTAIDLIADKGYKSVTMKEIADQAEVSEMTIFRHFGNKMKMLEEAVDRFYYPVGVEDIFTNKMLTYNLKQDLLVIGRSYHELMRRNRNILKIAYKEGGDIPGLSDWVSKSPRMFKESLMEYLQNMQQLGKVRPMNTFKIESHALMFISIQYGTILARLFVGGRKVSFLTDEEVIEESAELLYQSLYA